MVVNTEQIYSFSKLQISSKPKNQLKLILYIIVNNIKIKF